MRKSLAWLHVKRYWMWSRVRKWRQEHCFHTKLSLRSLQNKIGWEKAGLFCVKESADSVVFLQVAKGRYQRPLTSRDFIGLWKEKRYRRNMMFLFAGHSAGLLSKNFVKQSFTKFLESQLHDSRRKLYLSAPFFFHLRCEWLVRGRLYMPNLCCEPHHRICQFTLWDECLYWVLLLVFWIDGFYWHNSKITLY